VNIITLIIGVLIGLSVIVGILYVIFGQITVRKLRKSPDTKAALGVEFLSGWDIINVAQALAIPKKWASKFDRVLAFIFYWLLMFIGITGIFLALFDAIGVFD
jgi:hypothetical protein